MRRSAAVLFGAAVVVAAGCSSGAADELEDRAGDAADTVASGAVAELAVGRWRCETDQVEHGEARHLSTTVAIGKDGTFSFVEAGGDDGPLSGTWTVEDLDLRVSIPWQDDGRNGFDEWTYHADADPPTRITGKDGGIGVQDLEVDIESKDRLTIHQDDDGGEVGGVAYRWDVTCERTSRDPGEIAPTVPASPTGGD